LERFLKSLKKSGNLSQRRIDYRLDVRKKKSIVLILFTHMVLGALLITGRTEASI
jgi:hypothetical protein